MASTFQVLNRFPDYLNYNFVDWDAYKVGEGVELLGTDSVGVCLAITIYDPQRKRGILAHISGFDESKGLASAEVVDTLLAQLGESDTLDYHALEATLSGEGDIWDEDQRNSPIVREKLKSYGIPIIGEDLSRNKGRLIFLHCDTGQVEVYRA